MIYKNCIVLNTPEKTVNRFLMTIIALFAGAIMMQSFQCASRELTTAKVAMQNRDYPKAIEYSLKEIEKNPKSQEVYILLAQAYKNTGQFAEAAKALNKAEEVITDPKLAEEPQRMKYELWVEAYNGGLQAYEAFAKTKNPQALEKAIELFDVGSMIRPEMADFYYFKALVYNEKGDTISTMNEYRKAALVYKEAAQAGAKLGIYLDMDREQMINKLGAAKRTLGAPRPNGDSAITDYYVIDGKDLFVFSSRERGKQSFYIRGWRYNPNPKWLIDERSAFLSFDVRPMAELATYNYEHKQYDEALTYLRQIADLQPANTEVNSFMVAIYNETGKRDEALRSVQALINKNPDNKFYLAQYADILMSSQDFDQAITYYEKALAIDPNFDFVLRNVASAYKNKASVIQGRQADKMTADKTYTGNTGEYFPFLIKSAEYFTRSRESDRFKNDLTVLTELFNIYLVLDRKDDMRKIANELEALEPTISAADEPSYYITMVKVFSALKETEKLNKVKEKLGQ